ncbi:double-strand break repair helicase AddA [Roseovarius sp. SCSIO 43702]|uniref:double-strand break repair helicase AddA n=1 Tax=Roseovarius sp. SCSIO 43702 TaxID=2823043 RepID=UPI001C72C9C0|nr:double-strand break repair helicase AddA [Roseovarius sp. SCSIO 43702]QYX56978.1 double-strand break repair helicase AddA [Roseovarius sp. SCSIO 43702]
MDDATRRQIEAARPTRSTWLSANAGSGKTRVLTDRVARLLLEGVDPQHILCLTYTKAAASEMQNRLFDRLGAWSMLPDEKLRDHLTKLGITATDLSLPQARRLFATAIETPGGLRIQTIHSFCASLLRRFPLEAGVTPQFTELDDRTAEILRGDVVEDISRGPGAALLHDLMRLYTGADFDKFLKEILSNRDRFAADAEPRAAIGLPMSVTRESIAARVFTGGEEAILRDLIPAMREGGKTDARNCELLSGLNRLDFSALPTLEKVFMTQGGKAGFRAKTGQVPTKPVQKKVPHLLEALDAWMERIADARDDRLALLTLERTEVLHGFARVFLQGYDAAKERFGYLDFDDLIYKTRDLLLDPAVADWVLFRLDGGIDHILVDEAQDTNPVQWQVIAELARELTSGAGARPDTPRTIFVVGDKKQSIYSFQGADPRAFDEMRDEFARRLETAETPLANSVLEHSFRSSRAILDVVDATFAGIDDKAFTPKQSHIAFHSALPGRVDLWPPLPKPETSEEPPWFSPVDMPAENDPAIELARIVARRIAEMLERKEPLPDPKAPGGWRAMTPGDILILVQSRTNPVFQEIIRACKALDLPVAGADRLKLGAELAVRDLTALLSFLVTPEDDLSLATALRSPLFGWSEQDVFALAQPRGTAYLWRALRDAEDRHPETLAILRDLRGQTDFLRPYDLIERILTRHSGRVRLLSRLGPEAEDGIDALLSQALQFERNAVDSLTGFLVWMERDDVEIKRQLDNAGDQIRVMTVHGAKGLESPVVILPETHKRGRGGDNSLLPLGDTVIWKPRTADFPPSLQASRDAVQSAQDAERDRLLYVAMTRAEKWLIVAAAGETGDDGESWHSQIAAGLASCETWPLDCPTGEGRRVQFGDWAETVPDTTSQEDPGRAPLPDFFAAHAPRRTPPEPTVSPSSLPGAKALPSEDGRDTDTALREGRALHEMLEHLPMIPPEHWPEIDPAPLARALLEAPHLSHLFAPDTLAEVPITAALPELGGRRLHGVIDRLVISPDRVLVVDFKTNAAVPATPEDCPDGLLRQMGAYRAAVSQLYPDRQVDTAILWTTTGALMNLPHDLVTGALADTPAP